MQKRGDEFMAKSIIQTDKSRCFLCGGTANLEPLDCHHCFAGSNRKLSEKYGLKVYLHHNRCHIFGVNSVHQNAKIDRAVKEVAQKKAMEYYGWSKEDFIKKFGRNYL